MGIMKKDEKKKLEQHSMIGRARELDAIPLMLACLLLILIAFIIWEMY